MFEFETFTYLDVPKTASTFICSVLQRFCNETEVRRVVHGELSIDFDSRKFHFISVRDPLDQYISLYSFGCQGEGLLYARMSRLGLAQLYDGTWSGFEFWLKCVLDPKNSYLFDTRYNGKLAELIGFQSYRVFTLAVPGFVTETTSCSSKEELNQLYLAKNVVDYVIRYESLQKDLCMLVKKKLPHCMRTQKAVKYVRNSTARNASHRIDRYLTNPRLKERIQTLLVEREWLLSEVFEYKSAGYEKADHVGGELSSQN